MSILSKIEKPKPRPVIVTILGDAGLGKTSLASTFPSPVIIRAEDGVQGVPERYRPSAFPVIKHPKELWEQLTALCVEEHEYKTVIIDSITQLESLFVQNIVDDDPKKPKSINQAMGGYGAGWAAVAGMHARVRKAAQALVDKGINVVFIAHSETVMVEPPDDDSYTKFDLRMNKKSVSPYVDNVDIVGYLKLKTYTVGEDGERKKAMTDGTRVLTCYPVPYCVSKNRYGITEDLPVELGKNPFTKYVSILKEEKEKNE